MAKVGNDPDSATSQFFINLANNSSNLDNQNGGFTVFAKVDSLGMSVASLIALQATTTVQGPDGGTYSDVPVTDVVISKAALEP